MDFLMHLLDQGIAFFGSVAGQSAMIAVAVEFILRLFKSDKPLSLLYAFSFLIHKLGDFFNGLAVFLDKIIPQRLK